MVELRGTVSYDGQPIEQGLITLVPTDGKGRADGGEIRDGAYAIRCTPGRKRVEITGTRPIPGAAPLEGVPGDANHVEAREPYVPAKYNTDSTLEYEVEEGVTEKDFALEK